MFNDDDRVSGIDKTIQNDDQLADVIGMKSRRRLIEDVERPSIGYLFQFKGKFHPLCLAARNGGGGLSEFHIAEPDIDESLEFSANLGDGLEKLQSFFCRHVKDVRDILPLVADLKNVVRVSLAPADIASDIDVGKEVHGNPFHAGALAGFASSAGNIEREHRLAHATDLGFGSRSEDIPNIVEYLDVCRRIASRCPPDRFLRDVDDFGKKLDIVDAIAFPGFVSLNPREERTLR